MFGLGMKRIAIVTLVATAASVAASCANATIITSYAFPPEGEDLFSGQLRLSKVSLGAANNLDDVIYGFIATTAVNGGALSGNDKIAFLFSAQIKSVSNPGVGEVWTLGSVSDPAWQLDNLVDPAFDSLVSDTDLLLAVSAVTTQTPFASYVNTAGNGLKAFLPSVWSFEFTAADLLANSNEFFQGFSLFSTIQVTAGLSTTGDAYDPSTVFVPVQATKLDNSTEMVDVRVFNFSASADSTNGWTHSGLATAGFNIVPEPSGVLLWSSLLACAVGGALVRRIRIPRPACA